MPSTSRMIEDLAERGLTLIVIKLGWRCWEVVAHSTDDSGGHKVYESSEELNAGTNTTLRNAVYAVWFELVGSPTAVAVAAAEATP